MASPTTAASAQDLLHAFIGCDHLALVARRENQVFPALPLVGLRHADVHHPPVPVVVQSAEHARRHFGHQGAIVEVDPHPGVRGAGVEGQADGTGKHQVVPDRHGLVGRPPPQQGLAHRGLVHRRDGQQIGLHGSLEVVVVVELLHRRVAGEAVEEFQRTGPGFHAVRHRNPRRDFGGDVLLRCGLASAPVAVSMHASAAQQMRR